MAQKGSDGDGGRPELVKNPEKRHRLEDEKKWAKKKPNVPVLIDSGRQVLGLAVVAVGVRW